METIINGEDEQMESLQLPGFRFHPTDEELVGFYLPRKVRNSSFCAKPIGEIDLYKYDPWDLPYEAKAKIGEKEWYFFNKRERKYPTGSRTNRATGSGYWKATGRDSIINKGKQLVGMKRTLVFYARKAPKCEKTGWVTHEFRLEGDHSLHNLPISATYDWVISRIFYKSSDGKKMDLSEFARTADYGNQAGPSNWPPLTGSAQHTLDTFNNHPSCSYKPSDTSLNFPYFPQFSDPENSFSTQFVPNNVNVPSPYPFPAQDESFWKVFSNINGPNMKENPKTEISQHATTSSGAVDFDPYLS